jgi:hypothetical protein
MTNTTKKTTYRVLDDAGEHRPVEWLLARASVEGFMRVGDEVRRVVRAWDDGGLAHVEYVDVSEQDVPAEARRPLGLDATWEVR